MATRRYSLAAGTPSFDSTRSISWLSEYWRSIHGGRPTERDPSVRLTHTVCLTSHSTTKSGDANRVLHASSRPLPASSVGTSSGTALDASRWNCREDLCTMEPPMSGLPRITLEESASSTKPSDRLKRPDDARRIREWSHYVTFTAIALSTDGLTAQKPKNHLLESRIRISIARDIQRVDDDVRPLQRAASRSQ